MIEINIGAPAYSRFVSVKARPVSRSKSIPAGVLLTVLLLVPLAFGSARAGLYLEVDYELGGDTLASTELEDLDAGGGYRLAIGLQTFIGGFEDVGLIFSIGYLFDWISASNGDAEIDAFVAEFIYFRDFGPHRLGVGGSYHMNPQYEDDVDGFPRTRIDFDDALGLVGRYGYVIEKSIEFGVRYTLMDYEANGVSIDADSLGFYVSAAF